MSKAAIWPRIHRVTDAGPRALIVGSMGPEVPVHLHGRLMDLFGGMQTGATTRSLSWHLGQPDIAGSVLVYAATARQFGFTPFLSCLWPLPTPEMYLRKVEGLDADTTNVRIVPGDVPATLRWIGTDGEMLLRQPDMAKEMTPYVPRSLRGFEMALFDFGGAADRLQQLHALAGKIESCVVSVSADSSWTEDEFRALEDCNALVFLSERDAIIVANRIRGGNCVDARTAAAVIKHYLGHTRLIANVGRSGAFLMNGSLHEMPQKNLAVPRPLECKDRLMAATTALLAKGHEDVEALGLVVNGITHGLSSQCGAAAQ